MRSTLEEDAAPELAEANRWAGGGDEGGRAFCGTLTSGGGTTLAAATFGGGTTLDAATFGICRAFAGLIITHKLSIRSFNNNHIRIHA